MPDSGIFYAAVDASGGLKFDQPSAWLGFLKRHLAGKSVEVQIRIKRSKRSLAQNRMNWGTVLDQIAVAENYNGEEKATLHYGLLAKRFGTHRDRITGIEVPNKTSSQLSTKEMAEYTDWLIMFAATELGVVVKLHGDDF